MTTTSEFHSSTMHSVRNVPSGEAQLELGCLSRPANVTKPILSVGRVVLANSAWLIADKIVRMGLGLVTTVWLARQVGPHTFGTWNFAIAYAAIFGAIAGLGLDSIVVRELIREEPKAGTILGTALGLRIGAAVITLLASVISIAWSRPGELLPQLLVAMNATVFIFQSAQVLDYHFQAHMNSRPAVVAVNIAFLIAGLARVALLVVHARIEWFGLLLIVESAVAAALLAVAYRADRERRRPWRFDAAVARRLLSESWPLLLSGLAVMIYMRLDQVMLASMAGDAAVGEFSAALRIAEVWYFIPMAIMTAAFPALLTRKSDGPPALYRQYLQRLYDGMAWLGIGVSIVTTLTAGWIVPLLYGPAFTQTASILSVQIWAGVAVAMSFVHGKWLLAEGLQLYGLVYTVAGAIVNVTLNLILIPKYGALGSAWATLITQVGLLPIQLIFPKARDNFALMMLTLTAPYRLAKAWSARG